MGSKSEISFALSELAADLAARRAAILLAWRSAVDADPRLTTASTLPKSQFNDHIPAILDAFEQSLHRWPDRPDPVTEPHEQAAAHGLQRWQQGYHLREVTREWGHLHLILADVLESHARRDPPPAAEAMTTARRALAELCMHGVGESTSTYFELQQVEAAGHVRDLTQTLDEVRELERQRVELWRQAAHDLRGHVGAVANVTVGLTLEAAPSAVRERFVRLLQRSITSLVAMLDDVKDLARLNAGQERPESVEFDAALLLQDLCEQMLPMAEARGLFMRMDGPASLQVVGDPTKTRRIAQNLIINAIKYTSEGGVTVAWGDSRENDAGRWMLCVQDTGPGFHGGGAAPLAGALEAASRESRQVDERAGVNPDPPEAPSGGLASEGPSTEGHTRSRHHERGEGIGLSIVKRLAGLLDAAVEMESTPGVGTVMRVLLPRRPGER